MSYNDRQGDDTVAEAEGAQRHAAPHATRPQPVEPPEPPPPPLLPSSPHHPQGSNNNNNIPQRSNNFFRGVHVIVSGSSRLPHLPPPPLQKRVQRYHWTQVAEQPTGWPCSGPGAGGSVPERLGSQLSWRLRDQVSQQLEMYLATAASVLLWCAAVWGSRQVASEQGPSGGFARRGAAMLSRYSRHSDQDVANPEPPSVVSVSAPAGVGGGGQGAGQPELLPLWLSAPAAGDVGGGGAGGSRDPPGPPPSLSAVYDSLPSPLYGECTGAKSAICTPPTPPSSTAALWPMTSGVIMPTAAAASKGDVEQLAASAVAAAVTAAEAAFGRRTGGSTSTPAIGTAAAVAPPPTTPTSRANVGPLLQGGGSSWPGRPPGVNVLYHSPLHRAALSLKLTELGGVDFEEGCTALQAAAMEAVQRVFGGRRCGSRKPRRPGGTGARAAGSDVCKEGRASSGGDTAQAGSSGGPGVSGGNEDGAEATGGGSAGTPAVCNTGAAGQGGSTMARDVSKGDSDTAGQGSRPGGSVDGGSAGGGGVDADNPGADNVGAGSGGGGSGIASPAGPASHASHAGSADSGNGSDSGGGGFGGSGGSTGASTSLYSPTMPYQLKVLTLPGCIHLVVHVQGLAPPPPGPPQEPVAAPGGRDDATAAPPVSTGLAAAAAPAADLQQQFEAAGPETPEGEGAEQGPTQAVAAAAALESAAAGTIQQSRRALVRQLARNLENAVRAACRAWTTAAEQTGGPPDVPAEAAVGRPAGQPPPPAPPLEYSSASTPAAGTVEPVVTAAAPQGAEPSPLLPPDLLPRRASSRVQSLPLGMEEESSPFLALPQAPSGTATSSPGIARGSSLMRLPSWMLQEGPVPQPPHTAPDWASSVPAAPPPPTPHHFWTPSQMDSLASASHLGGTYSSVATTTTTTTLGRSHMHSSLLTSAFDSGAGGSSNMAYAGSSAVSSPYGIHELDGATGPYGTRLAPIPATPTLGSASTSTRQLTASPSLGPEVEALAVTAATTRAATTTTAADPVDEQDQREEEEGEEEAEEEEEAGSGWFALLEPPVVALPGEGGQAQPPGPAPPPPSGFATLFIFQDNAQPGQHPAAGEGPLRGASTYTATTAGTPRPSASGGSSSATPAAAAPPVARVLVHQGGRVLVDQGVALPGLVPVEAPPAPTSAMPRATSGGGGGVGEEVLPREQQRGAGEMKEEEESVTAGAAGLEPVAQLRLDLRMLHEGWASLLVLPPPPQPPLPPSRPPSQPPSPAAAVAAAAGAEPSLSYRARCQEALLSMPLLAVPPAVAAELRGLADSMAGQLAAQMYDEAMNKMYSLGGDATTAAAGGGGVIRAADHGPSAAGGSGVGSTGEIITAPDPADPRVRSMVGRDHLGPLLADLTVLLQDRDQDQSYGKHDDSASGGGPGSSVRHHGGLSPAAVQQLRGHVLQYLRQAGMQATAAYLERP